ncbi:MAG: RNB domain-containing ribonuclease, partial [Bacteroidaceae bacterium]|nr:RNB domain-containing ribonuclease [Bacteroidaceae bacterium]
MGKAGRKGGKRLTKKALLEALMDFFHKGEVREWSTKQIFSALHLTTHPVKMLCLDLLSDLAEDEYLKEVKRGHFRLNVRSQFLEGVFQRKNNGKNVFVPDDGGEEVLIAERNSGHAMNGDRVRIVLFAKRHRRMPEGEVIEILQRVNDTFVGTLKVERGYAFLLTESRILANDIFIPRDKLKGGVTGDKAVVKIVDWPEDEKNPIGHVIDVLGPSGENTAEMHAILAEYGLPYSYPESVEKAAQMIPEEIPTEEIARREDMRGVTTFTIDPRDAKDFDDALSIRLLKEGLWEVGVHIADVSHYVKEGGCIDKEALKRATS